ncbi:MAG: dephospho-CoA kinase [Nevskia sp.]|nr:dephospho-CoA kinase [Nevskia sp.]
MPRPLTIGLTGGVASGKSFVGGEFQRLGVPLLEADDVGREVVAPPSPALAEIAREFGADALTAEGVLDRRRMRERVFADKSALKRLEAITHPLIRARIRAWASAQTAPYCILSAAILLESGMDALVDRVLLVDAPEAVQLARLVLRDGVAEPLALQMIAAQASRQSRLARAHDVLDNSDTQRPLTPAIARLHRFYQTLAANRSR